MTATPAPTSALRSELRTRHFALVEKTRELLLLVRDTLRRSGWSVDS